MQSINVTEWNAVCFKCKTMLEILLNSSALYKYMEASNKQPVK